MNEPIADAVRSILDGHVVLSRHLAHAGHYPAIDVMASVSRLVGDIVTPEVRAAGTQMRKLMAAFKDKEDLIAIGAYQHGSDPVVDEAIAKKDALEAFLQQTVDDACDAEGADGRLLGLAGGPIAQPVDGMFDPAMGGDVMPGQMQQPGVGESAIPPLNLSV
jgi:flagellum-specific ATP synthase